MIDNLLESLTDSAASTGSPILMVVILAIAFALDPCAMLTNIAAIGYISKDIEQKHIGLKKGLWYTLGRTIAYGAWGVILIELLRTGGNISSVNHVIDEWGQIILAATLGVMGALLCISDLLPALKINVAAGKIGGMAKQGNIAAFMLGALLSLAFCPTNAIIFFGMMVPVAASSVQGYILPFIFAAITAIPVVITAYILIYSINSISKYYGNIQKTGKYLRWAVGLLFIGISIWLAIGASTESHHHEHGHHHACETNL